ncbi:hypothetical protein F4782DRAFT_186890 [Xylaria castorea]|nr:hypothetical protein F4782DRAFT_186890 [Xylaria castorea]
MVWVRRRVSGQQVRQQVGRQGWAGTGLTGRGRDVAGRAPTAVVGQNRAAGGWISVQHAQRCRNSCPKAAQLHQSRNSSFTLSFLQPSCCAANPEDERVERSPAIFDQQFDCIQTTSLPTSGRRFSIYRRIYLEQGCLRDIWTLDYLLKFQPSLLYLHYTYTGHYLLLVLIALLSCYRNSTPSCLV